MTTSTVRQSIPQEIGELFACEDKGDYCEVRTLFLDPSNDYIHLYCRLAEDEVVVSDFAETKTYLNMQMTPRSLTMRHMRHIQSVCDSLGLEFHNGEIQGRCRPEDSLPETIIDVAQASLRIAAIWEAECTGRDEARISEVADFLRSQGWEFCQD